MEVKGPRGKASDLQLWQIEQIRKAGGVAIVLYPKDFDDFRENVIRIEQGAECLL